LRLGQQPGNVIGRVFAVQQQPIEPGASTNLGAVGIGQAYPQTDLGLFLNQGLLEGVVGRLHAGRFQKMVVGLVNL
jgi:hypothetical protein